VFSSQSIDAAAMTKPVKHEKSTVPQLILHKSGSRLLCDHLLAQVAGALLSATSKESGAVHVELEWTLVADLSLGSCCDFRAVLTVTSSCGLLFGGGSLPGLRCGGEGGVTHLLLDATNVRSTGLGELGRWVGIPGIIRSRNTLVVFVVLFVQRVKRVHGRRTTIALSEVLTAFALLFLSVHRVANIEYLAEVDSTRRPKVFSPARTVIEVAEVLLQGIHLGRCRSVACGERGGERRCVRSCSGHLVALANPRVVQELLDIVTLLRVDSEEMRNEVLGRFGDVVPPWRKEGVLAASDLLSQDLNTLVIERRESAEECVENTTECPHVDTLGVALVFDNLGSSVADGTARRHSRMVPDDLGQAKIGDLDHTDSTGSNAFDELALVFLVLITGRLRLRVLGGDERRRVEQQVFGLDITA